MQIQDGQLPEKATGVADAGLPELGQLPTKESNSLKESRLAQAAVLRSEAKGTPVMEEFVGVSEESKKLSGDAVRANAAGEFNDAVMVDARDMFISAALEPGSGVNADAALMGMSQVEAENEKEKGTAAFAIKQYVQAISDPSLDMDAKKKLATDLYLQDNLAEMTQDISGWETARDTLLSVFIGPKDLYDAYQVTGELSPWKQEDQYRKFAHWFHRLDENEKLETWPAIKEYLTDNMPRDRAAQFAAGLLDPALVDDVGSDLSIWGSVDAAALGVGVISAAFKMRKLFNPIKAAARAGDIERSADANMALLENPGAAQSFDLDDWQVNTNALPFLGDDIDDAVASELSGAVHERIFQFRDRMVEAFTDLSEGRSFTREGFLDTEDTARAERRIKDEYDQYIAARFQEKDKIVNLTSTDETIDGRNFNFTVTSPDGTQVKDTFRGKFVLDDVGFWTHSPRSSVFFSELTQSRKTDFLSTVKAAIRLDNTAASVGEQLRAVIRDASKPIRGFKGKNRKVRIQEVDDILIAGDDMAKEFTPRELMAGVNGIKLDEDQMEYYYNMRQTLNGLGILRNMDARRGMVARGVKEINMGGDSRFFGTPIDDAAVAQTRLRGLNKIWKFDEVGRAVDTERLNMDELYAEGYRLMKLEEDTVLGGNRYQHVLVKSDKMGELPAVVLDLKKGYVSRINPNATYFVQRFTEDTLDGAKSTRRKALRSFDTKKAADEYAASLYAARGVDETGVSFHVVEDKELEAFKAGDSGMTQTGGLVYSPRAREPVPHNDGDATTVPRTSALESIELYLENTKNYMTRNDWRMGLRKKWENTAKFRLGNDVPFEEGENIANTELRTLWEKINTYSGFMDKSERTWEQTAKGMFEWSTEKFGRNRISDFILTQRQISPLARLRSATFHTLLGFFNPVQLWVQAQGAAVAASMNIFKPATLQKLVRQQGALTLQQHVNFNDSPEILRKLAKGFGYDSVEEMQATVEMWKKSGFYDSVLSSADVEAAARGMPTTKQGVKKFFDSGLMFFRAGELFNRRLAFLTAMDELGGAAKLRSSDKLFKEALDRANGLILNLGKANRASWQKGFLSIPTQFLQIQTKTIESLLGANGVFTKREAGKVMLGQMALYGAAGVFGGQFALRAAMDLAGKDQIDVNNMDPDYLASLTGGFTDWFAQAVVGADITAADRGALLNGMDQTFLGLFTEESSAFEWIGGPSAVGPTRVFTKLREMSAVFITPQDINGNVSFEAQDVTDTLSFLGRGMIEGIASPFSTGNQVMKYFLMRDLGAIRDKNGNLVANPREGFNWQTEWATLIGFKPELLQRKFDLSEINEETRKYVEFRTAILVNNWDSFMQEYERARVEGRDLDEDTIRMIRKRHNVLVNGISDPGVRRKVIDSYRNKLRNRKKGNAQLDRQMQQYYDNMLIDVFGTFTSTDTRLIQTRDTD